MIYFLLVNLVVWMSAKFQFSGFQPVCLSSDEAICGLKS